jgi:hypothetical protein
MYGLAVELAGIGMATAGWIFFRRSGVPFSTCWTGIPVWRSNQYLKPAGTTLWIAGCIVAVVGAILFIEWFLPRGFSR